MADSRTEWWSFIESIRGDMTAKQFASHVGISAPTLSRWRHGARPDPNLVISVARAADANIVSALVASGHLSLDEVEAYATGQLVLADIPMTTLLQEVISRLNDLERGISPTPPQTAAEAAEERGHEILKGLLR